MLLVQNEDAHDAFMLLVGHIAHLDSPERKLATALVTVVGMSQSVFGYPNEEAFFYDSRGEVGHGFYEVTGSGWLANVMDYNQRTYGSRHPSWHLGGKYDAARHFFVGSKDVSAQFLAEGLWVESFTDLPYNAVRDEALQRVDHWFSWSNDEGRPADSRAVRVGEFPDKLTTWA